MWAAAGRENRLGRWPAEVGMVHLDHGRDATDEAAVSLLERHLAVGRRVPRRDAEPPLELGKQPEASVHAAGDARANADDVTPRRGETELRVVGRDAVDLAPRDVEVGGHRREVVGGEPPPLRLDALERRQQPRPLRRKGGEERFDLRGGHGHAPPA